MTSLFKSTVFCLVFLVALLSMDAFPCTMFTAVKGEKVMFAGNENQPRNLSYLVTNTTGQYGVLYFTTESKQYEWLEMKLAKIVYRLTQ